MKRIEDVLFVILYALKISSDQNNHFYFSNYYKKLLVCYNKKNHDKISEKILKNLKDENSDTYKLINSYLNYPSDECHLSKNNPNVTINAKILENFIPKKYYDELFRIYLANLIDFRVAVVFSDEKNVIKSTTNILNQFNLKIISVKNLTLSNIGRNNLIRLLYAHETHWNEKNLNHFIRRVKGTVSFIFFVNDLNKINVRFLKDNLRKKLINDKILDLNNENHHIHFTDTLMESRWISNTAFNKNSTEFLNNFIDKKYKKFNYLIKYVNKELSIREDKELLMLDSGMAMSLHCLRDTNDIDFITLPALIKNITHRLMESHNNFYKNQDIEFKEFFYDPTLFCNYKNMKFLSLKGLLNVKKKRFQKLKSIKDYNDTIMISDKIHQMNKYIKPISFELGQKNNNSNKVILFLLKIKHILRRKYFKVNQYNIKEEKFILDQ